MRRVRQERATENGAQAESTTAAVSGRSQDLFRTVRKLTLRDPNPVR
jgi:hypothetical protein